MKILIDNINLFFDNEKVKKLMMIQILKLLRKEEIINEYQFRMSMMKLD